MLPRIAEDGRRPMQVYAAGFDRSSRRPRVGMLLAGIGLNEADSLKAIDDLPGGVTLAVSPYATRLPKLLAAARLARARIPAVHPDGAAGLSGRTTPARAR